MNSFYRIILIFLFVSVGACTSNGSNLFAGGDEDKDIGIGGTGLIADSDNGLGGTGIVGEITGYGSIFVNGIEIEYHDGTPFSVNGEAKEMQSLAIGDVVEVLTTDDNKHTQAMMMNLRHEVVGTVESVDPETVSFKVLGQTVIQPSNKKSLPGVGKIVAVSGFRVDEHTIHATRVVFTETTKTLLRVRNQLPFNNQTDRWLVQAHVRNGKANFELGGVAYAVSLKGNSKAEMKGDLGIRILQLKKSATGNLEINRVSEMKDMNRGAPRPASLQRPDASMMQRSVQGTRQLETQRETVRGER